MVACISPTAGVSQRSAKGVREKIGVPLLRCLQPLKYKLNPGRTEDRWGHPKPFTARILLDAQGLSGIRPPLRVNLSPTEQRTGIASKRQSKELETCDIMFYWNMCMCKQEL